VTEAAERVVGGCEITIRGLRTRGHRLERGALCTKLISDRWLEIAASVCA
jgi:hypothetical protein